MEAMEGLSEARLEDHYGMSSPDCRSLYGFLLVVYRYVRLYY
eukprot:COSAG02_NODE_7778_length_2848_cov_3.697818_1_plen_41_part_10